MTPTPTRRRWFQFGLRTMFVVLTLFAVWFAWELSYVRERKACLAQVYHGRWDDGPRLFLVAPTTVEYATIPFWRAIFGDEPVDYIVMGVGHTAEECRAAKQLFPEAQMYQQANGGPIRLK
jgi:hypothetical protein